MRIVEEKTLRTLHTPGCSENYPHLTIKRHAGLCYIVFVTASWIYSWVVLP